MVMSITQRLSADIKTYENNKGKRPVAAMCSWSKYKELRDSLHETAVLAKYEGLDLLIVSGWLVEESEFVLLDEYDRSVLGV